MDLPGQDKADDRVPLQIDRNGGGGGVQRNSVQ